MIDPTRSPTAHDAAPAQATAESRRSFIRTSAVATGAVATAFAPGLAKPAWAQKGVVKFGCSTNPFSSTHRCRHIAVVTNSPGAFSSW